MLVAYSSTVAWSILTWPQVEHFEVATGALSGPIVAAFALWLNYKERSKSFRDVLYQRQLDTYQEILSTISQLHFEIVLEMVNIQDDRIPDKTKDRFFQKLVDDIGKRHRWMVVIPDDINELVNGLLSGFSDAIRTDDIKTLREGAQDQVLQLRRQIREHLGIEPLTQETLNIISFVDRVHMPEPTK